MATAKWEYANDWLECTLGSETHLANVNDAMRVWAERGWELVSATATSIPIHRIGYAFFWRRPVDPRR
jgi:hypothetical protein